MVSFCQYIPPLLRGLFAGSRLQHMYLLLRWYVELHDLKSELMLLRLRLIHDRLGIEATIVLTNICRQTATTPEALAAGDGCHPDKGRALSDYLNNSISARETARRITAPLLHEHNLPKQLYRLWGLLSDGMAELTTDDRHKRVNLLSHIQPLPPASGIQWSDLPGFGSMWDSLNRLHLHGPDSWERSVGLFGREEIDELRRTFAAIGHAEAELFLRGMVPSGWGNEVLNLACSNRLGVDVFLSEIFAWLGTAGGKLREEMVRSENTVLRFTRPLPDSVRRENMAVEATLAEHWLSWKEALLRLSREGSELSDEGRRIAGRRHGLM